MRIIRQIPCKLDKTVCKRGGQNFASVDNHRVKSLDMKTASTITSRYYKGISADGDNIV